MAEEEERGRMGYLKASEVIMKEEADWSFTPPEGGPPRMVTPTEFFALMEAVEYKKALAERERKENEWREQWKEKFHTRWESKQAQRRSVLRRQAEKNALEQGWATRWSEVHSQWTLEGVARLFFAMYGEYASQFDVAVEILALFNEGDSVAVKSLLDLFSSIQPHTSLCVWARFERGMTHRAIADFVGRKDGKKYTSATRITQIINSGLRRLRHAARLVKLKKTAAYA
jgi:hypothetical protein